MPATLCLNMIVRNEERIIKRCLDSVADHIGAWVIADTGSVDRTPDIIQAYFQERGIPGELHRFAFVNFEQARNEALDRAWASDLAYDYLLLTDADMEMVVTEPAFRDNLTAPAYNVLQKNQISYWNDRLVRRGSGARYRGVTHEYLHVPRGRERLTGISFIDHAEGSNRTDKYARDIRLLTEDLARDPDNVRSWFYLAQSYRDSGQPEEAVKAYRRRVALGGWAEEAWYARLQIARCLRKLGDEAGFVKAALEAWNDRPHRAEPLYDLARYYRERGESPPSTLFAHAGMALPWPKDDALFIEDFVYDWGLQEEYAISGYYVPAHREPAGTVCNRLALRADIPVHVRLQARRNLRYYAKPLRESVKSFETIRIAFTAEPGYHAMNPSVVRWNGGLWMVQRTVNYVLTSGGDYITADGDPVRTRNYLLRLNDDLTVAHQVELPLPADLPPPQFGRVLGFEDMRPFVWDGQLWATATVREQNEAGWCETFLCRIDQAEHGAPALKDWRVLRPEGPRRNEKNWMVAGSGSDIKFIYSVAPTRIIDPNARLLAERKTRWAAEQVRGGSQAVPFGPGWLAVCHEHIAEGRSRYYTHRFVWFDKKGELQRISAPFNLLRAGVEFVAGLAWHPDGKRLVISFGLGDSESWIGTLPAADIVPLLQSDPVSRSVGSTIAATDTKGEKADKVLTKPAIMTAASEATRTPVFIHAGWRTGSTWFWSRFRPLADALCFYEPFNEELGALTNEIATSLGDAVEWAGVNHPPVGAYYREYLPLIEPAGGVRSYDTRYSYDWFIPHGGTSGRLRVGEQAYLTELLTLAAQSKKTAVLGFTRSLGRARAIRTAFGGVHILQYRNLWRQWCSYLRMAREGGTYFFATIPTLCNRADDLFLASIASFYLARHTARPLAPGTPKSHEILRGMPMRDMCAMFMAQQIYLRLNASLAADAIVDVTQLARDPGYRDAAERTLRRLTGLPVVLDDCRDPAAGGEDLDVNWDDIRRHGRAAVARIAGDHMSSEVADRLRVLADGLIESAIKECKEPALLAG